MIRPMSRPELDLLVDWAAAEGWNPGVHDADMFWETDPEGFVAAEQGGELVGGGSIVSYDGRFGFMGFFIVAPDHRGRGLGAPAVGPPPRRPPRAAAPRGGDRHGRRVRRCRRSTPAAGSRSPAATCGWRASARPPRAPRAWWTPGRSRPRSSPRTTPARFPAPRPGFVARWIAQPGARALAALEGGAIRGYGVVRPCRRGFKIGPLFAADAAVAEDLFRGLADHAAGAPLVLDVPEGNAAAMDLARRHGMREVFGCARMYLGPPPDLPEHEVFGVTTFELG